MFHYELTKAVESGKEEEEEEKKGVLHFTRFSVFIEVLRAL